MLQLGAAWVTYFWHIIYLITCLANSGTVAYIHLHFWSHISIGIHLCIHTTGHNCKWWWILAVRLTRGRQWRRCVNCDGEQTEDQSLGSRLRAESPESDWRQCCLSNVNLIRVHKPFCVYSSCNVHTFVAPLQTSIFLYGYSYRYNISCLKVE